MGGGEREEKRRGEEREEGRYRGKKADKRPELKGVCEHVQGSASG